MEGQVYSYRCKEPSADFSERSFKTTGGANRSLSADCDTRVQVQRVELVVSTR